MARHDLGPHLAVFRSTSKSILPATGLATGVIFLVGLPLAWWKGQTFDEIVAAIPAVLLVCGVLGVFLLGVVRLFATHVHEGGLRRLSFWSVPMTVPWNQIGAIEVSSSNAIGFVVLTPIGSRQQMWIPVDVALDERFQRLVFTYAGESCPLLVDHGAPLAHQAG